MEKFKKLEIFQILEMVPKMTNLAPALENKLLTLYHMTIWQFNDAETVLGVLTQSAIMGDECGLERDYVPSLKSQEQFFFS